MFLNCIFMALRELRANLLRTLLTMLGMIIGVSSVVIVVAVMQGVSQQVLSDISAMGKNMIFVSPARVRGFTQRIPFKLADATAIEQQVQGALQVAPMAANSLMFSANGHEKEYEVDGTTNAFFATRSASFTFGRPFLESELRGGSSVCILGEGPRATLFGLQNPLGAIIRSGSFYCRVVGVLGKQATSMITSDADDLVVLPLKTYHSRLAGNTRIDFLFIQAARSDLIEKVKHDVTALMRVRRGSIEGRPDNFRVEDIREAMKSINEIAFQFALTIFGVAAISLVVGGIGIMNVMLVSVTERTREIGIRLAVGARQADVLMQFLIEAVVLSLVGGLVGAFLGLAAAAAIGSLIGVSVSVTVEVLALAFGVPAAIGVGFGFFPALRASRLDPIEALRFE